MRSFVVADKVYYSEILFTRILAKTSSEPVSYTHLDVYKRQIDFFKQGRVTEAARLHLALLPLFRGLFMAANPIPVKAALNLIGIDAGSPRLPLLPLEGEALAGLKELLRIRELASA